MAAKELAHRVAPRIDSHRCAPKIMISPVSTHTLSFWKLTGDNPEWLSAFAAVLFGIVTGLLIYCQVRVMKAQTRIMRFQAKLMRWQGHQSSRIQRSQNLLVRLQHEHEWMLENNKERRELLKLARKLHSAASSLKGKPQSGDETRWGEVIDTVLELRSRLQTSDVASFTGTHDEWIAPLSVYIKAVEDAVLANADFNKRQRLTSDSPTLTARAALSNAAAQYDVLKTFSDMERAIRMELWDFKEKWDTVLS